MAKRIVGVLAMVLAGLGVVIAIILGIVTWVGHGAAGDGVNSAASSVNGALQTVEQRLSDLNTSIDDTRAKVQDVNNQAQQIAATNPVGDRVVSALVGKFDSTIGVAYSNLRDTYVAARERAQSLGDTVRFANRIIPGFDLPQPSGEKLTTVDDKLKEIDANLASLHSDLASASLPSLGIAQRITDFTARLDNVIGAVSTAVSDYTTQVNGMQSSVSEAQSNVLGWITWTAVLLTILAIWIAVANLALFGFGLAWFKKLPWWPWSASTAQADTAPPTNSVDRPVPEVQDAPSG